jgi:hypothetical protein
MSFHRLPTPPRGRLADRLFLGGCVATFLVLIGSVVTALQLYGS